MYKVLGVIAVVCGSVLSNGMPKYSTYDIIDIENNDAMGEYISPLVVDWDDDGDKDLIIGDLDRTGGRDRGRILFYENRGSNEKPLFNGFEVLKDDTGNEIIVSAS